jgi:hypothetical protein
VVADAFLRKMRGGSQSVLVGASDGKFYVLKLKNNPQGPNTLFNEAFGAILAQHLELPVPKWSPVHLGSHFIERNPDLSFTLPNGICAPSPGLHFGSEFVSGARGDEVYEIVPHQWMERIRNPQVFIGMMFLDIWTEHVDRRQALFVERSGSRILEAIFVDHGHMFGGPFGSDRLKNARGCLYSHQNVYRRAFESADIHTWPSRIESLSETMLRAMMNVIPCEWRDTAVESNAIALLMGNKRNLRQEAKNIAGAFMA